MALFYADASALVKLVRDEPESPALRTFLTGADLVSSELGLSEVPRAFRHAAAQDRHAVSQEGDTDRAASAAFQVGDRAVVGVHQPQESAITVFAVAQLLAEVVPVELGQQPVMDELLGGLVDLGVPTAAPRTAGSMELLAE